MIPMIQINQVNGQIGMKSEWGQFDIHTQYAKIKTEQRPAKIEVNSSLPTMKVDLRKSFNAISGGKLNDFTSRIYSQMPGIALRNISKVIEEGNRMAAIHLPGNPIADIAKASFANKGSGLQIYGPASYDNVDITFKLHDVQVNVQPSYAEVDVTVNKPEITFRRGKINIYMKQEPSLTIIPPQIDLRV